jgi:hypothetical protein
MYKPTTPAPKPPSPPNVTSFPNEGWLSTTRPTKCIVSSRIDDIIGYKDYYIVDEHILCTHTFSIAAVATTIDNGAYPLGSTELDDKTGHTCKMSQSFYTSFSLMVLGLDHNSWATACTKSAFRNLIIQGIDALMYYNNTDKYINSMPVSSPGDLTNMDHILTRLTLLLVGANACTPHIINSVWGADAEARLALGGPRGDLSLVCQKILILLKVAINTVHIWMENPSMPILSPNLHGFKCLPPTVQLLLHCTHANRVFARKLVSPGTATVCLLTDNLRKYSIPVPLPFEEKAIRWYQELLLNHSQADDMTGFDKEILMEYGMCPPLKLQEYFQVDPDQRPTHFMKETANEVWGNDTHEVVSTTAADWMD